MSIAALALAVAVLGADVAGDRPYEIQVIDDQTRRGVPLVELETTSGIVYVTDSAGVVAFAEPGLLGQEVWFGVRSHGYEYPADGFGIRGVRLQTSPGGSATVELKRLNIAERVCRLSGSGIYRDSLLTGRIPADEGLLLRARIMGYDSVQSAVYRQRLFWFWGDTNRPSYPLGHFHMTGATTPLPTPAQLADDPFALHKAPAGAVVNGLPYEYFTGEDDFARGVCQMAGDGPTWADGVTVLRDDNGRERMYAAYAKIRPPLSVYRRGICIWNDERDEFEHVAELPVDAPLMPFGHPLRLTMQGEDYILFGDPFPTARVQATVDAFLDLSQYEGFTPLAPGSTFADRQVTRDKNDDVVYGWKRQTPALSAAEEANWITENVLPEDAAHWQLYDAASKKLVEAHRGSVRWNEHRQRWVLIATQLRGTSLLGEVWYAEAKSPTGPFGPAVKIVTHDKYSFYNPLHHVEFDVDGGRVIHFEGTYTHTFSGNPVKTPRYDYNQILYRLDLSDPRLKPAWNK